ncbi:MAG: formylmethanofuran--tetrahydromethanopterin N-formyltransferase [Firmicutes bacterium]|nr:formylmethanofuran--tetrahydromethanopterin N-formyltransferase [Bacillota bacterium]
MCETQLEDTYCEAFGAYVARIVISADTRRWALEAARSVTGFATSVIGCGVEAAVERDNRPSPDGRPAVSVLFCGVRQEALAKAVTTRVGQCVLTCPTASAYDGFFGEPGEPFPLGRGLRYFGDGFQMAKVIQGRRFWRVPVMDGEFVVDDTLTVRPGVAGGNLILLGPPDGLLARVRQVARAMMGPGVILPFVGGVVRSGSKVGSRYSFLTASTNHVFVPELAHLADNRVPDGCLAYEIVVDGVDEDAVRESLQRGVEAARGRIPYVTAGNYGGKLGRYHFYLRRLADKEAHEA